jgi:hypothetical protein
MVPVAGTNALFFVLKNGAQFNPTVCVRAKIGYTHMIAV